MKKALRRLTAAAAMAWLLCMSGVVLAINPIPMPDFQLTTLDGESIKSAELPAKGSWLLVYVQATSHYSDQLLKSFSKDRYPSLPANAVFIVGGTPDDAKATKAKYADLSSATWYADPSKAAFSQLKLHGVPVILGVRDQKLQWSINGILQDYKTMQSILSSWIQQ